MGPLARHAWIAREVGRVATLVIGGSALVSCFSGQGSLGSPCATSQDCGDGQACTVGVCGRCGDGAVDPGEVCFNVTFDTPVGGIVTSLNPVDLDADGDTDLVAGVNTECRRTVDGPMNMPIVQIYDCWKVTLLVARDAERGFDAQIPLDVGAQEGQIEALALASFDGNDLVDALVVPKNTPLALLVFDVRAGVEGNAAVLTLPAPAKTPIVVDVDGNGRVDVVAAFDQGGTVGTALASEAGALGELVASPAFPGPRLVAADEFTGDGLIDLVAVSVVDGRVAVLRGDGLGAFEALPPVEMLENSDVTSVTSGDLDGDGDLDLVVLDASRDLATVLRGDGQGEFQVSDTIETGRSPIAAVVDDLDGDGVGDLIVSNAGEDRVDFWLTRDGSLLNQHEIDVSLNPGVLTRDDFDGDGVKDLAIANLNPSMTILYSDP